MGEIVAGIGKKRVKPTSTDRVHKAELHVRVRMGSETKLDLPIYIILPEIDVWRLRVIQNLLVPGVRGHVSESRRVVLPHLDVHALTRTISDLYTPTD